MLYGGGVWRRRLALYKNCPAPAAAAAAAAAAGLEGVPGVLHHLRLGDGLRHHDRVRDRDGSLRDHGLGLDGLLVENRPRDLVSNRVRTDRRVGR